MLQPTLSADGLTYKLGGFQPFKGHGWIDNIDICAITFLTVYGTILQMTWTLFEGIIQTDDPSKSAFPVLASLFYNL